MMARLTSKQAKRRMDVVVEKYLFYNKMHEDIEFVF